MIRCHHNDTIVTRNYDSLKYQIQTFETKTQFPSILSKVPSFLQNEATKNNVTAKNF